jgi:hypothetical protein
MIFCLLETLFISEMIFLNYRLQFSSLLNSLALYFLSVFHTLSQFLVDFDQTLLQVIDIFFQFTLALLSCLNLERFVFYFIFLLPYYTVQNIVMSSHL